MRFAQNSSVCWQTEMSAPVRVAMLFQGTRKHAYKTPTAGHAETDHADIQCLTFPVHPRVSLHSLAFKCQTPAVFISLLKAASE